MKILSKEFKKKVLEELDVTNIDLDNRKNLSIRHRYVSLLITLKRKLIDAKEEYDDIYRELYHYYKFEYDHALSKGEIEMYIRTNVKFKKVNKVIENKKLEINLLEEIISEFKSRDFTIKNAIDILNMER